MHLMQMTPPLLTESWGTLWSKTCLPSKLTACQVSSLHWHPTWCYPTATLSFVFLNELMEARCGCTSCFILEYESKLTSEITPALLSVSLRLAVSLQVGSAARSKIWTARPRVSMWWWSKLRTWEEWPLAAQPPPLSPSPSTTSTTT